MAMSRQLRALHRKYEVACNDYFDAARALSAHAGSEEPIPQILLDQEIIAISALTETRRLLLDAIADAAEKN